LKTDESEAGACLGSIHEGITILVFAIFFFAFNCLVINEGIVKVVLIFAIIFFLFFFNTTLGGRAWTPLLSAGG
jgi:hypothetical protein